MKGAMDEELKRTVLVIAIVLKTDSNADRILFYRKTGEVLERRNLTE